MQRLLQLMLFPWKATTIDFKCTGCQGGRLEEVMMDVLNEWECPVCEKVQMVDAVEYIEIGVPMCTNHTDPIEMEIVC